MNLCRAVPSPSALAPLLRARPSPGELLARWEALAPSARDALWAQAEPQGVQLWLAHGLLAGGLRGPRAGAAAALLARARVLHHQRGQALREALDRLRPCAALPLKGPALAARIYPEPHLRPAADLDLLVRADELERAIERLAGAGYDLLGDLAHQRYARAQLHHLQLGRPGGPLIELHFQPFVGCGLRLPAEALLERARPDERGVLRPDPVDELAYLALHAAGHQLERLIWLLDLQLYVSRPGAPTPYEALIRAQEWDAAAPVACALLGLHRLLGGPPPPVGWRARVGLWAAGRAARLEHGPGWQLAQLGAQAVLAPDAARAARFLGHHLGRIARRRLRAAAPGVTPEDWAG